MGGRLHVALASLALLATSVPSARAETWAIQSVAVGSVAPGPTSLVLVHGAPAIFCFGAPRDLALAVLHTDTKRWGMSRLDQGGEYLSGAADSSGILHAGYIEGGSHELRYARSNAGQTSIRTIDSESGRGGMNFTNSIQVDARGNPRISYFYWRGPNGGSTGRLKYAALDGASWTIQFVDATSGRGQYNSLALDAAGNPTIAYYDTVRALRIASRLAALWVSQRIDSSGDPGRFNSIAIDDAGRPHVSYIAATPVQLRYATRNGSLWRFENVATVGRVTDASGTSLALDSDGNPHIAYYDAGQGALRYASRSGGGWSVQTVDDLGDVGGYSSLRLDAQGRPIISYYDATSRTLKIAYGDYPDQDQDGIPDAFDPCAANPDCNANGIVDGREELSATGAGGVTVAPRLTDQPIFGCGATAIVHAAGNGGGGPPPADMLFLLGPAFYFLLRRGRSSRARALA